MDLYLGIELGSTRIKAVLIDADFAPVAVGTHAWENRLENDLWTYAYEDITAGLQACYADVATQYHTKTGTPLTRLAGLGISAMMHGYIPLGADGVPLAPFRTWRNTHTGPAAHALSDLFNFNIPLRWSIAHLYQAMLNGEAHVSHIAGLTTLAGYVHGLLTGQHVLGVGDASGMFPIQGGTYDTGMVAQFDGLAAHMPWQLSAILPQVMTAGKIAGTLTPAGAALLDPTGALQPGTPLCPPEGDAGTGMVATHSVAPRTGNISAGTSIFAMVVLEKTLQQRYPEIDLVTTPHGYPVAMVHCNNCAADLDAWVSVFGQAAGDIMTKEGAAASTLPNVHAAYQALFPQALHAEPDGGGLTAVSYLSGEHNTGFTQGRPLLVRNPAARLTLPNFMRTLMFASMATLKLGMDTLLLREGVPLTQIYGHGGLFTVPGVYAQLLAGALNTPVSVMATAGEGGAWGIALLAAYPAHTALSLDAFLSQKVFATAHSTTAHPLEADVQGFAAYMQRFVAALEVERAAVVHVV